MTIEFQTPLVGQPIGPGFVVQVTSDLIGPVPVDSYWEFVLIGGGELDIPILSQRIPYLGATTVFVLGEDGTLGFNVPIQHSAVAQGSPIRLRAQLRQPSVIHDEGEQTGVYEGVLGANSVIYWRLEQLEAQAATSTELQVIQQAVAPTIPGLGALGTVAQLLTGLPMGLLRRTLIEPDLEGEGELDHQLFGLGVAAFGMTWEVVSIPEGYGIQQGAPDYWSRVILKLGLVHTDYDSHAFISTTEQFNDGNRYWMFNPMLPTRVLYWIAPGVVLRFYWLTP